MFDSSSSLDKYKKVIEQLSSNLSKVKENLEMSEFNLFS